MSDFEVLQTYASWAGTAVPDKLPGIPFANLDAFENESILRNRLFYLVPDTSSGELRCFSYLEDNAPLPELMDRKKRDIMERKGDKEDENKRQKQQKESSAAAL